MSHPNAFRREMERDRIRRLMEMQEKLGKYYDQMLQTPRKNLAIVCLNSAFRHSVSGIFPAFGNQKVFPEVDSLLREMHQSGWQIIGVCNQGEIEAGKKEMADTVGEFMELMHIAPYLSHTMFCPNLYEEGTDLVILKKGEGLLPAVDYLTKFEGSRHMKTLTGYDGFRKPFFGMVQLAIDIAGFENSWTYEKGATRPGVTSIVPLNKIVGICSRNEDFGCMKAEEIYDLTIQAYSREHFVEARQEILA
jgi:hypothetical protein